MRFKSIDNPAKISYHKPKTCIKAKLCKMPFVSVLLFFCKFSANKKSPLAGVGINH